MRNYDSYIESNIDWIGRIPLNWNVNSLKRIVKIKITDGPHETPDFIDESGVPFISAEAIKDGKINFNYCRGYISKKQDKIYSKKCKPQLNDLFIVKSGSTTGKIAIVDVEKDFNIWSPLALVRLQHKYVPKYFYYYLQSNSFQNQVKVFWSFGTQPNIGMNVIERLYIVLPPFQEQQSIANYLDAKTQAIDKKVSLLEQKIETYKKLKRTLINQTITKGLNKNVPLKDSGISWIGQIPQHWEVKRFKDVLNLFTGNSISDKNGFDYIENSIPYVSTKDIDFNTNEINYTNGMYIPNSDKTFKRAKKGTCLICIEGANAGKKYGILNQEVAFVNKLAALKFKANRNFDKYLYYYIQSIAFSGEFFPLINGLIGGVSVNKLKEFNIILPPKSEQEEIAKYLDHKTATIDAIVGNISKQIETLKQLRKTLINDVVTGKIKVCDD